WSPEWAKPRPSTSGGPSGCPQEEARSTAWPWKAAQKTGQEKSQMNEKTVPPPTAPINRPLLQHHRDHLRTSGLSDETIAAAGIFSVTEGDEAGRLLGWSGPAPVPAIVFPYFDKYGDKVMNILRPETPRQNEGKLVKYESPIGVPPRLYFPPESL